MKNSIKELENIIKINFKNKRLLKQSLIHKSFNEKYNNEKLEFLGDRVIALVISQKLLPTKDGKGRVPACEVMISTTAIRNLIREDRIFQITSVIQSGGVEGMQTLDQDLQRLVTQGKIERKVAMEIADNPKLFKQNVL